LVGLPGFEPGTKGL